MTQKLKNSAATLLFQKRTQGCYANPAFLIENDAPYPAPVTEQRYFFKTGEKQSTRPALSIISTVTTHNQRAALSPHRNWPPRGHPSDKNTVYPYAEPAVINADQNFQDNCFSHPVI